MPAGLPELGVGVHLGPEDGACLMEYVSVLAGSAFSDHPPCTDPTLAELARLVNDSCTDAGRPQLASRAPALASTPSAGPQGTAAVVCAVAECAVEATGPSARLRRHLHRAEQRLDRVTRTGLMPGVTGHLDRLYRQGPARRRLAALVPAFRELTDVERDSGLLATLDAAILAARKAASSAGGPARPGANGSLRPATAPTPSAEEGR